MFCTNFGRKKSGVNLKDFSATFLKIAESNYTDEDNAKMAISLRHVKPWVITIWVVLVLEAALGIVKPELF